MYAPFITLIIGKLYSLTFEEFAGLDSALIALVLWMASQTILQPGMLQQIQIKPIRGDKSKTSDKLDHASVV